MMDVENSTEFLSPDTSREEIVKDDDDVVFISPVSTMKTPCTPSNNNGDASSSPATPQSATASKKRKRLTQKEREDRDKERAEKRLKLEEEKLKKDEAKRQREEERQAKLQQREEERLKREEEKRKKQEETDKRNKEKEDEKRKKQEEEERKKKEKEQKEEERQRKLEEKERERKKEEEKKAKQAQKFTSFFQKSPSTTKTKPSTPMSTIKRISLIKVGNVTQQVMGGNVGVAGQNDFNGSGSNDSTDDIVLMEISSNLLFNPMMFEVKTNMALAPLLRRAKMTSADIATLDQFGFSCNNSLSQPLVTPAMSKSTYLDELKEHKKGRYGRSYGRTELPDHDPDVQVISTKIIENPSAQGLVKWRYKLLQFHDNQRPAYWGTWKKQCSQVKPKKPLGQEQDIDYEFDSDDEWAEEPEDAEDLANTSDKESEDPGDNAESDEDDEEDGWLVPHGYISDDEGAQDEHLDKETLKLSEKDYFEGLNRKMKVHLPEIQTERLSEFKLIFSPLMKKWKLIK